jgi:serine/threonine-protein kinase
VPEDVASLLSRCLAKDPADRPNSAQELKDAFTATGIARGWTSERAMAWWKERRAGTEKPSTTAAPSSSLPTVAIDFAERIAE